MYCLARVLWCFALVGVRKHPWGVWFGFSFMWSYDGEPRRRLLAKSSPIDNDFCIAEPSRVSCLFAQIANNFSIPNALGSCVTSSFTLPTYDVYLMFEVMKKTVYCWVIGNCTAHWADLVDVNRIILRPWGKLGWTSSLLTGSFVGSGRTMSAVWKSSDSSSLYESRLEVEWSWIGMARWVELGWLVSAVWKSDDSFSL